MELTKTFETRYAPDAVWQGLSDVRLVAGCLPGAAIVEEIGPDEYKGRLQIKVGPLAASFAGLISIERKVDVRTAIVTGKGADAKSSSRVNAKMTYRVQPASANGGSQVDITSDINLAGALAQFGKAAVMQEIANRMTDEFVRRFEAQLAQSHAEAAARARAGCARRARGARRCRRVRGHAAHHCARRTGRARSHAGRTGEARREFAAGGEPACRSGAVRRRQHALGDLQAEGRSLLQQVIQISVRKEPFAQPLNRMETSMQKLTLKALAVASLAIPLAAMAQQTIKIGLVQPLTGSVAYNGTADVERLEAGGRRAQRQGRRARQEDRTGDRGRPVQAGQLGQRGREADPEGQGRRAVRRLLQLRDRGRDAGRRDATSCR